jgi:translocation and assembly module TamB
MKWLRRTLIGLLAFGMVAVAVVGAAAWLLGSEAGAGWLVARLLARTGPALGIERVSGSLLGGLVLEGVELRLERDELDFARLSLAWDPLAALSGTIAFSAARVSPVVYRRLPSSGGAGRAAVLELPFPIRLDEAAAESLRLEAGGETLELGATRFAAHFAERRLELERVTTSSRGVALGGRGELAFGTPVSLRAEVDWSGRIAEADAAGRLTVGGDWPVLIVQHELAAPFRAVAGGELRFDGVPRFDLAIEWQDLAAPGLSRFSSPSGRLSLEGAVDAYAFEGRGTLDIDGRTAELAVRGTGEAALLVFETLTLDARRTGGVADAGGLTASGELALDTLAADLEIAARRFDPSWWLAGWPGRFDGTAVLRGSIEPTPTARLESVALAGELRGYTLAASGALEWTAPDRWVFEGFRVQSGASVVVLAGSLDRAALRLDVDAEVADLDWLVPGVSGRLAADLSLDGSWQEPRGRGSLEARALGYRGSSIGRLEIDGELGLAPDTPLALIIEADAVTRGPLTVDSVRAELAGTTADHRVSGEARAEDWRATLAARGGREGDRWRGTVERVAIDQMLLGDWRLTEAARAAVGRRSLSLETSCLLHESGARACAELRLEGRADDRLVISAQNFELETLQPLLPQQLKLSGVYQLSASLVDLTGEPNGAIAISSETTRIDVASTLEAAYTTELDDVRASATLQGGRLDLRGSVRGSAGGRVDLRARIDEVGAEDSTIGGALEVDWPDLGFLTLLSPDVGQVGGMLSADLEVAGTVNAPELEGRAVWRDGTVAVPAWGLVLEQVEASALTADGRALAFDGTGRVGDGQVRLAGTTELEPSEGWPTRLTLRGESIRAVQRPNAEIFVSPDLQVQARLPDVRVTGTVNVPRAEVGLSELPAQAIAPSPDAVVHGIEAREEFRPLRLQADILLALGDDVHYSGLNLMTDVTGELRLIRDSTRTINATGTLTLAGTYNAYGQTLQLERGQLLFSGPLDDPGLDVRAVRTIDETRVGVELIGTVKAPRTRVFSDPAMSEADALSYLLLGRPLTGTGGEETATLQTAAISMGLQQALPVVQRIGQSLGLDEFTVQTTDTDAGALMAGKYLSPRVYIRYSYGLFNRIGGLLLRFRVNERLSIETRSGDEKSMDLLYTVEKD